MSKLSGLSSVNRAASEVSGQRHPFKTSIPTSTKTIAVSHAAAAWLPRQETTGIARMQPAKNAHAIVCATLTATKAVDREYEDWRGGKGYSIRLMLAFSGGRRPHG